MKRKLRWTVGFAALVAVAGITSLTGTQEAASLAPLMDEKRQNFTPTGVKCDPGCTCNPVCELCCDEDETET